jgi:hypothetical protein
MASSAEYFQRKNDFQRREWPQQVQRKMKLPASISCIETAQVGFNADGFSKMASNAKNGFQQHRWLA